MLRFYNRIRPSSEYSVFVHSLLVVAAWVAIFTLRGQAQFLSATVSFQAVDCVSCMTSLEERIGRLRGVESSKINGNALDVRFADASRVRLEQIRDFIEQGGSKAKSAKVRVKGELSNLGGRWILQPPDVKASYEVVGEGLTAGTRVVEGEIQDLRPASGPLKIHVTSQK